MNNKCKIVYTYFLESHNKISEIMKDDGKHKTKLLKAIRNVYPTAMHPYSFMAAPNLEQDVTLLGVIDIFTKYRNTWHNRIRRFIKR